MKKILFIFLIIFIKLKIVNAQKLGQPSKWQMNLQEAASPMMEGITNMHNLLLLVISFVAFLVSVLLIYVIYRYRSSKNPKPEIFTHNTFLEIGWTAVPLLIIIIIAIPSVKLMLEMEKHHDPEITIKITGKQWYWSYEYPLKSGKSINFDSHIIEDKDLKPGQLRLLDVDNQVIVPVNTTVQLLITGGDVLHSFAVPSLGIKKDAVPGRINETWFKINNPGTYYGQCSELCGRKHSNMPIAIRAVSKNEYENWLKQKEISS